MRSLYNHALPPHLHLLDVVRGHIIIETLFVVLWLILVLPHVFRVNMHPRVGHVSAILFFISTAVHVYTALVFFRPRVYPRQVYFLRCLHIKDWVRLVLKVCVQRRYLLSGIVGIVCFTFERHFSLCHSLCICFIETIRGEPCLPHWMSLFHVFLVLTLSELKFSPIFPAELRVYFFRLVNRMVNLLHANLQPFLSRMCLGNQVLLMLVGQSCRHVVLRYVQGCNSLNGSCAKGESHVTPQNETVITNPHPRTLNRKVELIMRLVLYPLKRTIKALIVCLLLQDFVGLFRYSDCSVLADSNLGWV